MVVFPMVPVLGLPLPCLPLQVFSRSCHTAGFPLLSAPPAALCRPGKLKQGPHHSLCTVVSWDFPTKQINPSPLNIALLNYSRSGRMQHLWPSLVPGGGVCGGELTVSSVAS